MNPTAYLEMAEVENMHWWFCARREIISECIERLNMPDSPEILEVGCGTGGNISMLSQYGNVSAMEMDETALEIARNKNDSNANIIRFGYCPENIPFPDGKFDLICMFDVLEHIDRDSDTLIALKKKLKKNGLIVVTVPAYQFLYGPHDEFLHHKRRYTASNLKKLVKGSGFNPIRISYFNTILFPIAVVARVKDKMARSRSASGAGIPGKSFNNILFNVFKFEKNILRYIDMPYGVSLLCIIKSD